MDLIKLVTQSYRGFVPNCEAHGILETIHVYIWDLISGPAFCRVRYQLLAPGMEQRLLRTVQDFARFFASAWIRRPEVNPPPGLLEEYSGMLAQLSQRLPVRFQPKLDEVRQSLPLLFRPGYPMTIQHDDLLENNIHVDEATGSITGIVDWQDAMIAPFGVSLSGLETVLGVQTQIGWHLHPSHVSLREQFWDTFYREIGEISKADQCSIEVARLLGLFRTHGPEDNAAAYLDALCPL
ncbi:phosphotransferase enzyme family domain-containing protein [Apiospora arundinis]